MKFATKFKHMIKSYSFWTTLAGSLALVASAIGKAFSIKIEEKIITDIVMAIAGVLVAVGVVTMPSDKSKTEKEAENTKESQLIENEAENVLDETLKNEEDSSRSALK